jgi:hypothetical protein
MQSFFGSRRGLTLGVLLLSCLLAGCSDSSMSVAPVSGKITLDGEPLKRASVVFMPKGGGRPSHGVTDEQGRYVLEYSLEELGAQVGTCAVRISTAAESDDSSEKSSKQMVPKKYLQEPFMEVQVASKSNTIDIDLKSN